MSPNVKEAILKEINTLYEDKSIVYKYDGWTEQNNIEYKDYLQALTKQFGNDLPGKDKETKFLERYLKTEILK